MNKASDLDYIAVGLTVTKTGAGIIWKTISVSFQKVVRETLGEILIFCILGLVQYFLFKNILNQN